MKHLSAIILTVMLFFSAVPGVGAQAADTIWMETDQQTYNATDTITVTIQTNITRPFQGLTFQIRYDPACLQPANPISRISGLNYMSVPQTAGLVDAIFASTTSLNASGPLATIQFMPLADCHTNLKLENASLEVLNESGMAIPLQDVTLGASSLVLKLGEDAAAASQSSNVPEPSPTAGIKVNATEAVQNEQNPDNQSSTTGWFDWLVVPMVVVLGLLLIVGLFLGVSYLVRGRQVSTVSSTANRSRRSAALVIKRGQRAGETLPVLKFPCRIGSAPENDICLMDARIATAHAEIFANKSGYSLVDLGSQDGTYLNGRLINNQQVLIKAGDVLHLGGVILVFDLI